MSLRKRVFFFIQIAFGWMFVLTAKEISFPSSFESLMGGKTPAWQYLQTPEDFEQIHFFKTLYEKNPAVLEPIQEKIPKILHFIWLGPKELPSDAIKKIDKWLFLHPDWSAKLWTDLERPSFSSRIEHFSVYSFPFHLLRECYDKADNFGEKARILSYEILYREGGLYADCDTLPYKAFDGLNGSYDFYCGLELLAPSVLSTSVFAGPHILASRPLHPILLTTLTEIKQNWDQMELAYGGKDWGAKANLLAHRSLYALTEGIKKSACLSGMRDTVFPSFYFSSPDKKEAIFSLHEHLRSWEEQEKGFWIQKITDLFKKASSERKTALFFLFFFLGVSIIQLLFSLMLLKNRNPLPKETKKEEASI